MFEKNMVHQIENGLEVRVSSNIIYSSIYRDDHREKFEEVMKDIIARKPIDRFLEIGTHEGLATTFLTQFCNRIDTIDIRDYIFKYKLWYQYKVKDMIYAHVCKTDQAKRDLVAKLKFDFAFVDGDHQEGVLLDWELVKHCGRVLFHDYKVGDQYPEKYKELYKHIINLVDSLPKNEVTINPPFAYWEKK